MKDLMIISASTMVGICLYHFAMGFTRGIQKRRGKK